MEIQNPESLQEITNIILERELPINLDRLNHVWSEWQKLGLDLEILIRYVKGITYISFDIFKESLHKMFAAIDEFVGEGNQFVLLGLTTGHEANSNDMMTRIMKLKYGKRIKAIVNQIDLNKNQFPAEAESDFALNKGNYHGEKIIFIDDWSLSGKKSQLNIVFEELFKKTTDKVITPKREDILITTVALSEDSANRINDMGIQFYTPNPLLKLSREAFTEEERDSLVSKLPEKLRNYEDISYILTAFNHNYSVLSFYKVPDNFSSILRRMYHEHHDYYIDDELRDLWIINDTKEPDVEPRIYPFYKERSNYDDILLKLISE